MRIWWFLAFVMCFAIPAKAQQPAKGMSSFASDAALKAFIKSKMRANRLTMNPPPIPIPPPPPPSESLPPSQGTEAGAPLAKSAITVTDAASSSPNITNRQEADVDEGGIVKVYGNYLVILRRGRLFTVSLADKGMKPVSAINAFPPATSGNGAWYDEMLVSGNRVIVVGYSYARGGTEINRFTIDANGGLTWQDSHHLTSDDYYSSRNYASRLIGTKLIVYAPIQLELETYMARMPSVRRWDGNGTTEFRRIAPAKQIYMAAPVRARRDAIIDTVHSVSICDLAAATLDCRATAVLGSYARTFYVSGKAVYIWVSDAFMNERGPVRSVLYRMPLDGSRPSAALTLGAPVDQFSFREDRAEGILNVVVRAEGRGDWMWSPEVSDGDVALLRLPVSSFDDGSWIAPKRLYRKLPETGPNGWSFHNRFAGQYLLYSGGGLQERNEGTAVHAVPVRGGAIRTLAAPHGVDRIELLGADAVVVGGGRDGSLGFTGIELGADARLGDTFRLPASSEGEQRSHAFFFRNDSPDGASGLLGLPVTRQIAPTAQRFLGNGSAIVFLNRKARKFGLAGELEANGANARDDGCQASCVDWYGNARPIFLGTRLFALMGYELVEGTERDGRIAETGRVDFAPGRVRPD